MDINKTLLQIFNLALKVLPYSLGQAWANYSPGAIYGPLRFLIRPIVVILKCFINLINTRVFPLDGTL